MKMKLFGLVMSLMLFGPLSAQANTVDVSYTISGSPGNWLYDFTVTNNLGGNLDIYAVAIFYPNPSAAGSPSNWVPQTGVGTIQWCDINCYFQGGLAPGQTLSGFVALDTSTTAETSLSWQIIAIDPTSCGPFGCTNNPAFTGEASATPLPAALPLFATGLGALGLLGWRRKRKAAAVAA
jgi:hypothetical protein